MAKLFLTISDVLTPTLGFRRIRGAHIFLLFFDVIVDYLLMPVSMFTDFLKEKQQRPKKNKTSALQLLNIWEFSCGDAAAPSSMSLTAHGVMESHGITFSSPNKLPKPTIRLS